MGQIYPMGQTVAQFAANQLTSLLRAGKILNPFEKEEALNCLESISLLKRNGDQRMCVICKTHKQTGPALPLMPLCHSHLHVIIDASARTDIRPEDSTCHCGQCTLLYFSGCERKIPVWEGQCYSYLEKILCL
ncbi:MAG: hypothetical protein Q7S84_03700 [bacterium]|nr:hypothetical protein [bacterium]